MTINPRADGRQRELSASSGRPRGTGSGQRTRLWRVWSGSSIDIAFSKTHGAGSFEFFVNNHTTPPGGMFDKTSARCVGLGAMLDGKRNSSSYCEATDKDGDKFMVRNLQEGPKATQEGIAGTGKYEGMVRTGISEPLGAFPPPAPGKFTGCARQTGTYKMK